MSLQTLATPEQAVAFLRARVTGTLQTDSRLVAPGDAFIAWPGAATDGRAHVAMYLFRPSVAGPVLLDPEGFRQRLNAIRQKALEYPARFRID